MRYSPGRAHHPHRPVWRPRTLSLAAILTLIISFVPAGVARSAPAGGLAVDQGTPNLDSRTSIHAGKRPTADQIHDLNTLPSVRLQWDEQWGEPSSLLSDTGYLTSPSHASPEAIARQFLRDHAQLFGLSARDLASLAVANQYLMAFPRT